MPSSSHFVRKVRRRSCSRQALTPLLLSRAILHFDQPLKSFSVVPRAGNNKLLVGWHIEAAPDAKIDCAVFPIGNLCSRLFLVSHDGRVIVSPSSILGVRCATSVSR